MASSSWYQFDPQYYDSVLNDPIDYSIPFAFPDGDFNSPMTSSFYQSDPSVQSSQDYLFDNFLSSAFESEDSNHQTTLQTQQISPPIQPTNPQPPIPFPNQTPDPIARRILRYGCHLCPGKHFEREKASKNRNNGVNTHIFKHHPQFRTTWKSQAYRWGYRVRYESGYTEDIPFAGNAASQMSPEGGRGSVVVRKGEARVGTGLMVGSSGRLERRRVNERKEPDIAQILDEALFVN